MVVAVCGLSACAVLKTPGYDEFQGAVRKGSAIQIYDTLEFLIAGNDDSPSDRKAAFRAVRYRKEDTAEFQFAWAAIAGRLVQQRGLLGIDLVGDIETHAIRSRELDPTYRNGAATRLLGTMYVIAPSSFLEHGNSELGLEMLEGLVAEYPNDPENHLRLAEAYIALNDPQPAHSHLCVCMAVATNMRADDRKLLKNLMADAGKVECPGAKMPEPKKRSLAQRLWPGGE